MREKQNDLFTIGVVAAIILIFAVADLFLQSGGSLATGNSPAVQKPSFAIDRLSDGVFAQEYERYCTNNFRSREKWEKLWMRFEILTGRRDVGGVYLGKKHTYFEQHPSTAYTAQAQEAGLEYLEYLVNDWGAKVMLVPTADVVWADRLPAYADVYDQKAYLRRVQEKVGEENMIDVCETLFCHADEEIYYRTDSRWTTLGAYYGYHAWWQKAGKLLPYYYDPGKRKMITDDYLGRLQAMSGQEMRSEELLVFSETIGKPAVVSLDTGEKTTGYYREEFLGSEDPYRYFLGEETGFAKIQTGYERTKSLLIIRDSFANSMIPLLAPHYRNIYLLDLNLYDGQPEEILKKYSRQGKLEVLVLSGVPGYLEAFRDKE